MSLGRAVIDGISVPVTSVSLHGGKLILQCTLAGPVRASAGGAVTIFGDDDAGICQGYSDEVSWPEVKEGETLMVSVRMQVANCYGDAEGDEAVQEESGDLRPSRLHS